MSEDTIKLDSLIKEAGRVIDMSGVKYDKGKRRWSLMPFEQLEDILEILEFGAEKYLPDNWKKVPNSPRRYFEALMRHVLEYKKGFDNGVSNIKDEESGKSSLAHAGCCLLFLMWHAKQQELLEDKDNKLNELSNGIKMSKKECKGDCECQK